MAITLAGLPVQFVRRPRRLQPVRRLAVSQTPLAWLVLTSELLGLPKYRAIESWQAVMACPYSEAQAVCSEVLAWVDCAETWADVAALGLTPARLIHVVELCILSGTLSPREAAILEAAILAQVGRTGQWQAGLAASEGLHRVDRTRAHDALEGEKGLGLYAPMPRLDCCR